MTWWRAKRNENYGERGLKPQFATCEVLFGLDFLYSREADRNANWHTLLVPIASFAWRMSGEFTKLLPLRIRRAHIQTRLIAWMSRVCILIDCGYTTITNSICPSNAMHSKQMAFHDLTKQNKLQYAPSLQTNSSTERTPTTRTTRWPRQRWTPSRRPSQRSRRPRSRRSAKGCAQRPTRYVNDL